MCLISGFTSFACCPERVSRLSDTDECASGNHVCHSSQMCVNSPGAYSCVCPRGYRSYGNGQPCQGTPHTKHGVQLNNTYCNYDVYETCLLMLAVGWCPYRYDVFRFSAWMSIFVGVFIFKLFQTSTSVIWTTTFAVTCVAIWLVVTNVCAPLGRCCCPTEKHASVN